MLNFQVLKISPDLTVSLPTCYKILIRQASYQGKILRHIGCNAGPPAPSEPIGAAISGFWNAGVNRLAEIFTMAILTTQA